MSAYRAMIGMGTLNRTTITADAKDLPFKSSTDRYTPKELVEGYSTATSETGTGLKWHRFGANISDDITYNRNVNVLNDLGTRYYTVTTVGRFEPSMTISGLVSYDEAERWMQYAFNMDAQPTASSDKKTYVWSFPTGAQTFDIAYIQANNGTNDYAGENEYHIMTGCAINSMELSYEVGADMGFKFSLEIMGLSDFWCTDTSGTTITESNIESWFDPAPTEVFTAGCVSLSEDPASEASAVAQTDKGVFKLENFLSYRGACGTTYASGYSLGTMNFTLNTDTYSNDPDKYEKYFYGYDTISAGTTMCPTKQLKPISYMYLKTSDADPEGDIPATKSLCIKMEGCKVTSYNKSYSNTGDAIMDSPEIRPQKASVIMYEDTSSE